jgi:hypothetical protein
MVQDFMRTIGALREAAVGNCRKRIEEAAIRAKGMIGADTPGGRVVERDAPPCGISSVLKRKHGL